MSEPISKGRVLVAMSGGVDSSAAAALLVEQGYEVIDPLRIRKLLLNQSEIKKIKEWIERKKGVSVIPLKAYFKKGKLKLEVAFAEGKKQYDKRATIKKREQDREASAAIKRSK